MTEKDVSELDAARREYLRGGLRREDLKENPVEQFGDWLAQAMSLELIDPTAMSIATVGADGQPSQRTVLLKHFDAQGFVFYTNLESRKAKDIGANPKVSLLFAWLPLERQVKICGAAVRISTAQALKYFLSRPRDSQLAAWASQQSRAITSRQMLEQQFAAIQHKFAAGEVPLPAFWGGYRVIPHEIEFWQGRANRLHDRFRYRLETEGSWRIERLSP